MSESEPQINKNPKLIGIIPELEDFESDFYKITDAEPSHTLTDYGHAQGMLLQAVYGYEDKVPDKNEQRQALKKAAEYLIDKYGLEITKFMRHELREALGLKE